MSRGRDILPMKRPVKSVSHLYKCMHMHTHEITPLKPIQPLHLMTKRIRFISQKHKSTPLNRYLSGFTRAFSQHKHSAETCSDLGCFPLVSGTPLSASKLIEWPLSSSHQTLTLSTPRSHQHLILVLKNTVCVSANEHLRLFVHPIDTMWQSDIFCSMFRAKKVTHHECDHLSYSASLWKK